MNNLDLAHLDWSLVQSLIAVAEEGSLSAAARRLRQSQPTLGRHITAIEAQLGQEIFIRTRTGLALTDVGAALLAPAKDMEAAAARLNMVALGRDTALRGTVRITASVMMAHYVLPPILAQLRTAEPEIELELHASDETDNLLFHEADIAVRMFRPQQLDVVTRHVGDVSVGIYAADAYLDRAGTPQTLEDLRQHQWVGYDRSALIIDGFRNLGVNVDRGFFGMRCDNQTAYWQLVAAGCGIGVGQNNIARKTPGVREILTDVEIAPLPIWLTAHAALRKTPRVRRVYDFLDQGLQNLDDMGTGA